ncbi:MAG: hypothetical protein IJW45_08190 [Oscillospiraceae bacterium]|nr:hypothetical protein [Oscillospiraceae bacterium]
MSESVRAEMRIDTGEMIGNVEKLETAFEGIQVSLDMVVEKMEELVALMAPQTESLFEGLIGGVGVFNTLAVGRTNLEGIFKAINTGLDEMNDKNGFDIFDALIPQTQAFAEKFNQSLNPMAGTLGQLGSAFNGTTLIWIGAIGAVIAIIWVLVENWDAVVAGVRAGWTAIQEAFGAVAEWFDTTIIQPLQLKIGAFWEGFIGSASETWEGIKRVFSAFGDFFGSIFSAGWGNVMSVFDESGDIFNGIVGGVGEFFFRVVNGLIDGINAVIASPLESINVALRFVRDISIMGLQPFRGLGLIDVWKIPHLAQGAVLPANRPFLAVVGDQKHGTNVEAPLETIQEAVALVMGDVVASNMAGHEATVGVLREILDAVLGIEIGDEVIGRAAARYGSRMAVVRGVR